MKSLVNRILRRVGFEVRRYQPAGNSGEWVPSDVSESDRTIIAKVRPYTVTSVQRLIALIDAVRYVSRNQIPGDMIECGVWRGGSMMAIALTLLAEKDMSRRLYLYDTFEGMSEPTADDTTFDGIPAEHLLKAEAKGTGIWHYAALDEVRSNLASTGYPVDQISYVQGRVEETVPGVVPEMISLLRLDTDWYESTRHELLHMYPRLVQHGVLIIDDYGHFQGAKKATDEHFSSRNLRPLLQRIDYTGRLVIKAESAMGPAGLEPATNGL